MAELGADGEDHVGRLQRFRAGAPIGEHAMEHRVALAHRSPPADGRDDRGAEAARDGLKLMHRPRRDHAAARDHERRGRAGQQPRRLGHVRHVAGRPDAVPTRGSRRVDARRRESPTGSTARSVPAAAAQQVEGAGDCAGDRARIAEGLGPATHRPEAVDLVGDLVQRAHAAADQLGSDVRGDQHHRHRAGIGLHQRRQGVGGGRPGRHDRHARLAGRPRVAIGHEARASLVPGQHVADGVLGQQRVVDGQIVESRNAEDRAHALGAEGVDHVLASARRAHDGGVRNW